LASLPLGHDRNTPDKKDQDECEPHAEPYGPLDPPPESASLASTVGARVRISSGFGIAALGGRGDRRATVQHVEAERNEQSGAGRCAVVAVEEDWAAAHPQSSAKLSNPGDIIDMALSAPSQTDSAKRASV
jgi:hypothetical protein